MKKEEICLNFISQHVSVLSLMSGACPKEFPHSDAEADLDLDSHDPIFVSSPSHAADVPGLLPSLCRWITVSL